MKVRDKAIGIAEQIADSLVLEFFEHPEYQGTNFKWATAAEWISRLAVAHTYMNLTDRQYRTALKFDSEIEKAAFERAKNKIQGLDLT